MTQSKFDKQVEETAETLAFGIGRFLTGRDLDGIRRTDATFFRTGRRVLPKVEGRVRRASYQAGWQRLAVRLTVLGAVTETGYLAGRHPDTTFETARALWEEPQGVLQVLETSGIGAAGVAVAGGLAYGVLGRERRELMREWIVPLHEALHRPLGIAEQSDPRRYLHIPKNFSDDDAQIRIALPTSLAFSRDVVADLITQKLALEGVTFAWHPAGAAPYVLVKMTRKPPARALFKDPKMRELVAKAPESAPLIGIGASGRTVAVDLDAESPHILINASPGGGKSVTMRGIACQMLHHGARVFVLDYKRISHPWARGIDGATYCADIADIHDALIQLGAEGRRRIRLAEQLGIDADPHAIGPRLLLLLEEVNATMRQLARYWDKTRRPGEPKTSPAVDALNEVLFMGRQTRLHVLLVAQSATARALGGPEVREQFAMRPGRHRRHRARDAGAVLHRRRSPPVGHHRTSRHREGRGRARATGAGAAGQTVRACRTARRLPHRSRGRHRGPPTRTRRRASPGRRPRRPGRRLEPHITSPGCWPRRGRHHPGGNAPGEGSRGRWRPGGGGAARGPRAPPAGHHPRRPAPRPRPRPHLPGLGRQARHRTPLPRRRPQKVGP
ncbi:pRL2-11 [Streptomyces sp. Ac-502]|uniref:pRL2-11 n=1 Tax=Streptomyces sp. Ac-502 TaxID=3342801 RepID=UPI0038624621